MSTSAARFELTIPVQQTGKIGVGSFYTLWGMFGLASSYGLFQTASVFAEKHPAIALYVHLAQFIVAIVGGLIYVYIPYQIALARAQGSSLLINEDGVGMPSTLFGIGAPRWVSWSDVEKVEIGRSLSGKQTLMFSGKGLRQSVKLAAVSQQDMEQMLFAIEAWAPSAVWSTAVLEYRDSLQIGNYSADGFSQTQLFEDELAKRFSAPTFVPLEPERTLRSGTIKVLRQLAFGGFSAVYLAEDSLNGLVVLKESVAPATDNEEIRNKASELFAREALLLRSLDHSDIAKVFDFFVEDGRSYIVMEHVDGINLRQLVAQRGAQSEENVLDWTKKVAAILEYLHGQAPPIVHRDVTPDNLVLTNLGQIKLIDFGASNQYLGNVTGTLVGKHAYMPPEQIRGKAEPASDLFALGGTMHYLLTGVEPEPLSTSRPARVNPSVSAFTDNLVAELTELDVSKRLPSAVALLNKFRQTSNSSLVELPVKTN